MTEQVLNVGKITSIRNFHQLGIFLLDGSGSMTAQAKIGSISKADAVNMAMRDLLTKFKTSRVRDNFSFAVVKFDTSASIKMPITDCVQADDQDNYNPTIGHGGGTYIYAGLDSAKQMAEDFIKNAPVGGVRHSVVVLLMTDGECGDPSKTLQTATDIKNSLGIDVVICSCFFQEAGVNTNQAAKNLLQDIATDRIMGFKEVYDADSLRTFFEKSISAASGGIIIG